jgi:hypothetical protein
MRPWHPAALLLSLSLSSLAVAAQDAASLDLSNQWRIQISENATSDGELRFLISPEDGTPLEVAVTIKDGRGENGIAKDIRDRLRQALDAKAFHVEVDDGEDVRVQSRSEARRFELRLLESTVQATRIDIDIDIVVDEADDE